MIWTRLQFLLLVTLCLALTFAQQNDDATPTSSMDDESLFDDSMDSQIPMMADDPSSLNSKLKDKDMGIVGIVTLWPKESMKRQDRLRPRPDQCPKWSEWKNVTCWWPSMALTDLPQECAYMPLPKKVPQTIQDLIRGQAQDAYNAIVYEYEQLGKPAKCGYCSRSFRCRSRNMTKDGDDIDDTLSMMNGGFDRRHHHHRGHGGRGGDKCQPKEIQPVHDECDDHSPCELTKENGVCKSPFFLNPAKIDRVRKLIKQRDHQGAADELYGFQRDSMNMNMGDGGSDDGNRHRQKRQASDFDFNNNNDDYDSDVYGGYGMNRQFDSPPSNNFNGFDNNNQRQQQQRPFGAFGGGNQDPSQFFGPGFGNRRRQGFPSMMSFGPNSDNDNQRSGPFGPNSGDRQGRQGPPPFFGPGDEGNRGPFKPKTDGLSSSSFGFPNDGQSGGGRQGSQGQQSSFGSGRNNENRRPGPFGFGGDDSQGRQGPFGPGNGDGDNSQQGPFGSRHGRRGPQPPSFGPGGDNDRRPGQFGPRNDDDSSFGPWNRQGRQGPQFGPGSEGRRGRHWPRPPFGPAFGPPHSHHNFGQWFNNQNNNNFAPNGFMSMRQTLPSSMQQQQQGRPDHHKGGDSRGFVYRLLHETNCVSANEACLCCCGPYIPNVANNTCDDLRQLLPGIENTMEALMNIDNSEGPSGPQPPMAPPPTNDNDDMGMEELLPADELPFEEPQIPQQQQQQRRRNHNSDRDSDDGPSMLIKHPKPDQDFK